MGNELVLVYVSALTLIFVIVYVGFTERRFKKFKNKTLLRIGSKFIEYKRLLELREKLLKNINSDLEGPYNFCALIPNHWNLSVRYPTLYDQYYLEKEDPSVAIFWYEKEDYMSRLALLNRTLARIEREVLIAKIL